MDSDSKNDIDSIKKYYDSVYYHGKRSGASVSGHLIRLAKKVNVLKGQRVLDIGCGTGEWLMACRELGAVTCGVDLSDKAIDICRKNLPEGIFYSQPAEQLPFEDNIFDLVTCLGSLEHFIDPVSAVKEMVRVAKSDATIIILVPNKYFLTRRLKLFTGTDQVSVKEDVRSPKEWEDLFESAGLTIEKRWKDLHVLSWAWITLKGWIHIPFRALQALLLIIWPLDWQYQIYYAGKQVEDK